MAEIGDDPDGPLEDIAYLARSANRIAVLEALTSQVTPPGKSKRGYTRRDLADRTETSRTTLGRILTEFEERGWAVRSNEGGYIATPIGEHVAAEFEPLVNSMDTLGELGEAAAIVPSSELTGEMIGVPSISIRDFSDATVRKPDSFDPTFFGRYFAEIVRGAHSVSSMVYIATPQNMLTAVEEELQKGDLMVESVFSSSVTDHILENPGVGPRQEHAKHQNVDMYRYSGHIPCNLFVVDDIVLLENSQVDSVPDGTTIETQGESVREWALAVIEGYIEESERITPDEFF